MKSLWQMWQHGAWLAVAYTVGLLGVAVVVCIPGTLILGLWGLDETTSVLLLSPIWLPLGLGMVARSLPSDRLKPDGYEEPEGHYAKLARRIRDR